MANFGWVLVTSDNKGLLLLLLLLLKYVKKHSIYTVYIHTHIYIYIYIHTITRNTDFNYIM